MQKERALVSYKEALDAMKLARKLTIQSALQRSGVTIIETTPDGRARAIITGTHIVLEADTIEELQAQLAEY